MVSIITIRKILKITGDDEQHEDKGSLYIGVKKQSDKLGHPDSITATLDQLQKLRGGNSTDWILFAN